MTTDTTRLLEEFDDPKLRALLETMVLAAYADGEFSEKEREHFAASVESLTNGRLAGEKFRAFLDEVLVALRREGREQRLAAIKRHLPQPAARKVALSLAVQVTASDGILRTSERELIEQMAESLEIDRDEAADLVIKLAPR